MAVCSEIHTNTLCGQKVELLIVTSGGTYSDHWDVKVKRHGAHVIKHKT